tara:strand:- start:4599 stop:4817 length:219 start_codon:yes stop_codon:yes gene_type:complete
MEKKYAISRNINGISLNGREYALDENNNVMLFETEKEAVRFVFEEYELRKTDPHISDMEWLECSHGIYIDTY